MFRRQRSYTVLRSLACARFRTAQKILSRRVKPMPVRRACIDLPADRRVRHLSASAHVTLPRCLCANIGDHDRNAVLHLLTQVCFHAKNFHCTRLCHVHLIRAHSRSSRCVGDTCRPDFMTEESLPLINHKNQHVAAQSFWEANARKLGLLLLLLVSGCLGLGVKFWLEKKETSVSLDKLIGSHEVPATTTSCPTHTQTVILAIIVQQLAALRIRLDVGMVIVKCTAYGHGITLVESTVSMHALSS